jgi:hypothetical protein
MTNRQPPSLGVADQNPPPPPATRRPRGAAVTATPSGGRPAARWSRESVPDTPPRVCVTARIGYSSEGTTEGARGRGSVGRASPCQGEGRGFESRRPLGVLNALAAEWPSGLGKGLQSPVHGFDSRLRLPLPSKEAVDGPAPSPARGPADLRRLTATGRTVRPGQDRTHVTDGTTHKHTPPPTQHPGARITRRVNATRKVIVRIRTLTQRKAATHRIISSQPAGTARPARQHTHPRPFTGMTRRPGATGRAPPITPARREHRRYQSFADHDTERRQCARAAAVVDGGV